MLWLYCVNIKTASRLLSFKWCHINLLYQPVKAVLARTQPQCELRTVRVSGADNPLALWRGDVPSATLWVFISVLPWWLGIGVVTVF